MVCWCGWVGIFFPFHSGKRKKPYPEHRVSLTSTNEYSMNYIIGEFPEEFVCFVAARIILTRSLVHIAVLFLLWEVSFSLASYFAHSSNRNMAALWITRAAETVNWWPNGNNKRSRGYLLCFVSEERLEETRGEIIFFVLFSNVSKAKVVVVGHLRHDLSQVGEA